MTGSKLTQFVDAGSRSHWCSSGRNTFRPKLREILLTATCACVCQHRAPVVTSSVLPCTHGCRLAHRLTAFASARFAREQFEQVLLAILPLFYSHGGSMHLYHISRSPLSYAPCLLPMPAVSAAFSWPSAECLVLFTVSSLPFSIRLSLIPLTTENHRPVLHQQAPRHLRR